MEIVNDDLEMKLNGVCLESIGRSGADGFSSFSSVCLEITCGAPLAGKPQLNHLEMQDKELD